VNNYMPDPSVVIAKLKREVARLKDELALATGTEAEAGPLTEAEMTEYQTAARLPPAPLWQALSWSLAVFSHGGRGPCCHQVPQCSGCLPPRHGPRRGAPAGGPSQDPRLLWSPQGDTNFSGNAFLCGNHLHQSTHCCHASRAWLPTAQRPRGK
jgi:hypothetical protein